MIKLRKAIWLSGVVVMGTFEFRKQPLLLCEVAQSGNDIINRY